MDKIERNVEYVGLMSICKSVSINNDFEEITQLASDRVRYRLRETEISLTIIPTDLSIPDILRTIADDFEKKMKKI